MQQNRTLIQNGKLTVPVLTISADQGSIANMAMPLRAYADDVRGEIVAGSGHFIPEEQPKAVADLLTSFLQIRRDRC